MEKKGRLLFLCIALLTLTSCIQVDTVVKVKKDGSGVIEETFLMKKELLRQMEKMAEEMAKSMEQTLTGEEKSGKNQKDADSRLKAQEFHLYDEAKLKERVKDMGEGVTYLGGSKIVTDDYEGYRTFYAFTDINKVRMNQNSGDKIQSGPLQDSTDEKTAKQYITFMFTKGKPAELLIKIPESKSGKNPEDAAEDMKSAPKDEKVQKEMTEQIKGMFQGMKIALSVAVDGNVLETNAAYREGPKITLMELDFGKLIEMPEQLAKLSQSKPKTLEEFTALIRNVPGIKVDLNREIRIKFDQ